MKVLFAVKVGDEDWQEELITECEEKISAASEWAKKNGFDRLRIADIPDGPPDFSKVVNVFSAIPFSKLNQSSREDEKVGG
jgi:hypothetical protein